MKDKDNVRETLEQIETLLAEHDKNQPYSESDIKDILTGLRNIRASLSNLQDKYLNIVENSDKIEYRVRAVEDKLDDMDKQEEVKHNRELKYIDYAVCSVIGSLVGYYISKLTGGH